MFGPVGGWQIYLLNFTQGLVNATNTVAGSYWEDFFDAGTIDNDAGNITDIQSFLIGNYPDINHTACNINFTAIAPGTCTFEIVVVEITDTSFELIEVMTKEATITII